MKRFGLALVIVVVVASAVAGQSDSGMSGQAYTTLWPTQWRMMYAVGYRQGFVSGGIAGTVGTFKRLEKCMDKWTYGQFQAVVEQYIRQHPAESHEEIGVLAQQAMRAACRM